MSEPRHVDGNALGGVLSDVFVADLTMATTTCAGCGHVGPLATLDVYLDAPGAVARCRGCAAVQLRLVQGRGSTWLDMSGIRTLQIPNPASGH